jgi:hypothetical protein
MDYAEALKTVSSQKVKDSMMLIKLGWDTKLILPFKDGVAFMSCLVNAEVLLDPYDQKHSISEYRKDAIETRVMSHSEYVRIKVAALLGVKPDELLEPTSKETTT